MTTSHTSPVQIEQAMPLAEMSVAQIAALPQAQLQEAHINLLSLQSMVKAVLERMHTALDQRYAERAKEARLPVPTTPTATRARTVAAGSMPSRNLTSDALSPSASASKPMPPTPQTHNPISRIST